MKNKDIFTHPTIAILLAITSGGIDAYTFIEQGGVFAGLQLEIQFYLELVWLTMTIPNH
ncbi:MAG: hypothetical protein M3Z82_08475 [Apilactobacillus sp.]|uniref:hypothetical protein n=1 Tax=Apilactobacillus nanyangensis TaxID=2799579 RepID=UPI001F39F975|nr:hypothetical protein [Apilactobacillus nanyangensis]MCT6859284.1 hypothetical protein [Apilactobacillus sp.]